ncbi:unnamed protein product [Diamesa serratosioi]
MNEILNKPIEKINELQSQQCNNTEMISRINDSKVELNSFFTEYIDPNHVELVDKLHEFDSKLLKLRCEKSDETVKGSKEMTDTEDSECEESLLQKLSCIFSEPEAEEISKNVSKAVNFTLALFNGNEKQCGIANSIRKCWQHSRMNCDKSYSSKPNEFNTLMDLFECKVDETFEITKSTRELLTEDDIVDTLKNATGKCNFHDIQQNFMKLKNEIESKLEQLQTTKDLFGAVIETLCRKDVIDLINEYISKTASTLSKCVDPNYVNHVEKLKIVALRSIGVICKSPEQSLRSAYDSIFLIRNKFNYLIDNHPIQLAGCVITQNEVRELIADRSLISNFTLDLLEGSDRKCEALNAIQMCLIETFDKIINKEFSKSFKHISDIAIEALDCNVQVMLNGWNINENNSLMYKEFIFNDFNEAFGFMTRVALYAAQLEYYPEFDTTNNKVKISVILDQADLLEGSKKKCEVLNDIQMCFIETFDKTINKEFSNSFKHISDIIIEALDSKRHFQVMLNGWNNSENQSGMYKEFIFNDFNEAFGFMTRVALYAAQLEYYPELYTANNKVKISVVSDQVGNSLNLLEMSSLLHKPQGYIDFEEPFSCNDKATISRINDREAELNEYFSNCIDPNNVEFVEKLHKLNSKLMKQRCEMSDEDAKEFNKMVLARKKCDLEIEFQFASCYFSEPQITLSLKNVSNVVDSHGANDKECGVVNRMEKCVENIIRQCDKNTMSKTYNFNTLMDLFECKVDETFEIPESTTEPMNAMDMIMTYQNVKMSCKFDEIEENFLKLKKEMDLKVEHLIETNETYVIGPDTICWKENIDRMNEFISETSSNLTKKVDPKYVNHVEKFTSFVSRSIVELCKSNTTLMSMIDVLNKRIDMSDEYLSRNLIPIARCIFSQVEVRELIADKSLISNFTLDLLEGSDKKCGTLNEVQSCLVGTFEDIEFSNSFKHISDIVIEALDCKRVNH